MSVITSVWGPIIGSDTQSWDADLDSVAAQSGLGLLVHTAANTYGIRTLAAPAAGLAITNPAGTAGNPTFALANDLAALEGLGSTGLAARTATDTWAQRTITGTGAVIVTNGDGVAGNPSIEVDYADESVPGLVQFATDGEYNAFEAVSAADGRLAGPWQAISLASGTVSISAPTQGFIWEIMLFIASSEAVLVSGMPTFINGETTVTNYWNQQITGSNAASGPNENNNATVCLYAGSTSLTGAHAFNRILIPGFRDTYQKMLIVTQQAATRSAGDAVVGTRVLYRTGASVGAVNDAVTSFGYTLPNSGTHAAGSYGYHRWVAA